MDSAQKNPLLSRIKWIGTLLLSALAIAIVVYLLWFSGLFVSINSVLELREWIDGFGVWSGVIFFLLQMLTVIFAPIPSNITTLAGALALGFWRGFLLSATAVFAGSMLMFLLARRLGARFVAWFVQKGTIARYMPVIEEKRDVFLFMSLLLPFFPDDALCILAGLTGMSTFRFCVIALIARPWGLLFAALVGGGMISLPLWGWVTIIVAVACIFILSLKHGPAIEEKIIARYHRRK